MKRIAFFTMTWATQRKTTVTWILFSPLIALVLFGAFYYVTRPTCSDGKQNQNETGIDCGGVCDNICRDIIAEPAVLWAQEFLVRDDIYNVVALVENPNFGVEADIGYSFKMYDSANSLISERRGQTTLLSGRQTPIFEGTIQTGNREPIRTTFEITDGPDWRDVEVHGIRLSVRDQELIADTISPSLSAILENDTLETISDVEVVAVLYDGDGNAVHASRTFVNTLGPNADHDIIFTWPEPFELTPGVCEVPFDVVLAIDRSGSMNDVSSNPPQPITAVKEAAQMFVSRLTEDDRVGIVSFATHDSVDARLGSGHDVATEAIGRISIFPQEESGFTNLGDGVVSAHQELLTNGTSTEKQALVLLTDGRANWPDAPDGETYATEKLNALKDDGVIVYTIGLGDQVNDDFLRNSASDTNFYYKTAGSDELNNIYTQIGTSLCERPPFVVDIFPLLRQVSVSN